MLTLGKVYLNICRLYINDGAWQGAAQAWQGTGGDRTGRLRRGEAGRRARQGGVYLTHTYIPEDERRKKKDIIFY